MRKLRCLVLFLFTCPASAQLFSAGVKGGVPLTDFFTTVQVQEVSFTTNTNRYIIGPTAELHLPFGLGVEVDALYRHMSYTSLIAHNFGPGSSNSSTFNSGRWEFPLLLKYRFKASLAHPFVDAGIAWDTLSGISESAGPIGSSVGKNNTTAGFVAGVGADIHLVIHIMPEIRYTRWGSPQVVDGTMLLKSNQNQAEFLLGITF